MTTFVFILLVALILILSLRRSARRHRRTVGEPPTPQPLPPRANGPFDTGAGHAPHHAGHGHHGGAGHHGG